MPKAVTEKLITAYLNQMKTKIHTVEQPDSDITTFIISCNRLFLLEETINSFLETRDLITKIVIVDDSGVDGVFEKLVEQYGTIADIICFPKNRSLWWAKDFMASYCYTDYIFYLEDDWKFLKTGYLSKSKKILDTYRDVGIVDISWRTFEEEGLDSYHQELVDNEFYYKKPWRISNKHLHWFVWCASPNLKRRDDLLILGRVEKYFNEWHIDRKFYALGYRGVFLNDRYVYHIGDEHSLQVNNRENEHTTPDMLIPEELHKNRTFPIFNYYGLDNEICQDMKKFEKRTNDKLFVTALLNIDREKVDGRNFNDHYLSGLKNVLDINKPLAVFIEKQNIEFVLRERGSKPTICIPIDLSTVVNYEHFQSIKSISEKPEWYAQSEWMKESIIRNPLYLTLTHLKMELLILAINNNIFNAFSYYWIDAGIYNSFYISHNIKQYKFDKLPKNKFFATTFPYFVEKEVHGFSKSGYLSLCGKSPNFVTRASFFGGPKESIIQVYDLYKEFLRKSIDLGFVGTEESILTGLSLNNSEAFDLFHMNSGDINGFLNTLLS